MSYKIVMSKEQLETIANALSQLPSNMIVDEGHTVGELKELCEQTLSFPENGTTHGFVL